VNQETGEQRRETGDGRRLAIRVQNIKQTLRPLRLRGESGRPEVRSPMSEVRYPMSGNEPRVSSLDYDYDDEYEYDYDDDYDDEYDYELR